LLCYGGYLVAQGRLAPGSLVAVFLYWDWFMNPAMTFGTFFSELLVAMSSAERLFVLLDEPAQADGTRALPRLEGRVEFEGVSFEYEPGRPVLHDIAFRARPGMTVALVGATGSGKSTILALLARFQKPTAGRILVDGADLAQATQASFHHQVAIVLQANHLFHGTLLDNLRYGRPAASLADVERAARELGCHERFLALRDGYRTDVGERGGALSLGERQLVCFTRALVAEPSLLLLDEATSAVDPATEAQVQEALRKLAARRTTFIVAHRLSTILGADLILVLDHGRIVERGTHAELLRLGGTYARLHAATLAPEREILGKPTLGN
jgi:ATP-binding cassette subfamily B protein